jgi:predicted nucleic acid-binding protein
MGLILDSSVLITAERQGQNARQMLAAISGSPAGNTEIAISVVTALELGYSVATANLRHFQMIPGLKIVSL